MQHLVSFGAWIVQHPKDAATYALLIWSGATVIAGLWLWRQAVKETGPRAAGMRSDVRRVG